MSDRQARLVFPRVPGNAVLEVAAVDSSNRGDALDSGAECPLAGRSGGGGGKRPGMSGLRLRGELSGMTGLANLRAGILAVRRNGEKQNQNAARKSPQIYQMNRPLYWNCRP